MKNIYLTLILSLVASITFGQVVLRDKNGNEVDWNDPIVVQGSKFSNPLDSAYSIKNIGDEELTIYVTRIMISQTSPMFQGTYCDDNMCYPGDDVEEWTNSVPIVLGTSAPNDTSTFKPAMFLWEQAGTAEVQYILSTSQTSTKDALATWNVTFISVDGEVSIEKNTKLDFSIYPNPAQNEITLRGDGLKNGGTLVFLDALGKEVKRNNIQGLNQKISINSLNKGVYFLILYDKEGIKSETKKLIVR